jgi:hypothetical protein
MDNIYAVRKRRGQWVLCSGKQIVLEFENYDEAVQIAHSALQLLAKYHLSGHVAAP